MIIPWESLEPETLDSVIKEFILREGTDYGEYEVPLTHKVEQIKQQLKNKQILLLWSELTESVNIIPADSIKPYEGEM